jgi:septal ring factor EnvC (AmiA/AmiB activator)
MAEIVFNTPTESVDLESQVQNLQTTLASLNQQVIVLQETLRERDQKIRELETALTECKQEEKLEVKPRIDDTLTIVGAFIKLYKLFLPGKVT